MEAIKAILKLILFFVLVIGVIVLCIGVFGPFAVIMLALIAFALFNA